METGVRPGWSAKQAEGKMFQRLACVRCGAQFNFADRVTAFPVCPACGSTATHPRVA